MYTSTKSFVICALLLSILISGGCGVRQTVVPTITPIPPTATSIPPTATPAVDLTIYDNFNDLRQL
jgi:hypothetical protein